MSDTWSFGRVEKPEVIEIDRRPDIPFQLVGYRVEAPCDCTDPAALADGEEVDEHADGCNTVTGARLVAGEEVAFDFTARGSAPQGSTMRMVANADVRGNADVRSLAKWIQACLVEDDRDRWWDTLDDDSVHFDADGIRDLAVKLMEVYGERPTQSRSARRGGVRHNGRTSEVVPSGRAFG